MLADLRAAARAAGHPEWGHGGPHDAGHYNSRSWETGFFVSQGGNWQTEYGHFFLSWYSGLLVRHARRILGVAAEVLNKPGRPRMIKAVQEVSLHAVEVVLDSMSRILLSCLCCTADLHTLQGAVGAGLKSIIVIVCHLPYAPMASIMRAKNAHVIQLMPLDRSGR